jgi:uncharacterized protein (DUF1800 family)
MTADSRDMQALKALTRFGLGPRPGDLKRIAPDPRGAVEAELMKPDVALLHDPYLRSGRELYRGFMERNVLRRLGRGREVQGRLAEAAEVMRAEGRLPPETAKAPVKAAAKPDDATMGAMSGPSMSGASMSDPSMAKVPAAERSPQPDEVAARFVRALSCDIGFVERWVGFWTNHFAVSSRRQQRVSWLAGAYEREAIRPHALGKFSDMVLATSRHPAMLNYLNLEASTGPKSSVGKNNRRGLNENYAREALELHTVGVDGGYSQADVTALALALTGWRTVRRPHAENNGMFEFVKWSHEPGPQTVMGTSYPDDGLAQGEAILKDLARKPATARHLARRVATAFVSDDPPPALVERLESSFRETDGDLKELARVLILSDEAWSAPRTKMRSAQEFVFGIVRAFKDTPSAMLMKGLEALDQPVWAPLSPKGYSIYGRDWLAPDAQTNRLDLAVDVAQENATGSDPNALALDLLGDVMSDETATTVKRAGSREQAIALLLMSPELQRR